MSDKFYWCGNCLLSLNQDDVVRVRVCRKCNHVIDMYKSKLDCLLDHVRMITGIEAKEDLIRYIVCDGEPADESCIGHPVLTIPEDLLTEGWEDEEILTRIGDWKDHPYIFENEKLHQALFAKKIPGYDYTQKVEVSDE